MKKSMRIPAALCAAVLSASILPTVSDFPSVSASVSAESILGAPTGLKGGTSKGNVVLSWSKVKYADAYRIYYSTAPKCEYTLYETVKGTKSTVKGLTGGTTYYFKVSAIITDDDGEYEEGKPSKRLKVTLKEQSPVKQESTGMGLKAADTPNGTITFTWNKVKGASYYVYSWVCGDEQTIFREDSSYRKSKDIQLTTTTAKIYVLPGQTYKFTVTAHKKNGDVIGEPAELKITAAGNKNIITLYDNPLGRFLYVNHAKIDIPIPADVGIPASEPSGDNDKNFDYIGKIYSEGINESEANQFCVGYMNKYINKLKEAGITVEAGSHDTGHDTWAKFWANDGYNLYYKGTYIGYVNAWYGYNNSNAVMLVVGVEFAHTK